jgi:hypothetical protein
MRWRRRGAATVASGDAAHVREAEGVASTPGAAHNCGTQGKTGDVGEVRDRVVLEQMPVADVSKNQGRGECDTVQHEAGAGLKTGRKG